MARPRLRPGEWGKFTEVTRGGYTIARARIRDTDGVLRVVQARGRSPAEARRLLLMRLQNREQSVETCGLTSASLVEEVAEYWLGEKEQDVSAQTLTGYRDNWEKICKPRIGKLRVNEVSAGVADALVRSVARKTPGRARTARVVCTGVFSTAVRLDLIVHNPFRETRRPKRKAVPVRSLTPSDLVAVRRAVAAYCDREDIAEDGTVRRRLGPKPGSDVRDVLELLIATGARIGEVLALRWVDVDLDGEPPTATLRGTLIVPRARGERLRRQDYRKGEAPQLTVVLPEFAVSILRRRKETPTLRNPHGAVFVTTTGNWMSPANVRRSWRAARGAAFAWVTPHSFRRTVATVVKEHHGVGAAQSQLGHANSRVTETHYVERVTVAPDLTDVLNTFAPENGEKGE